MLMASNFQLGQSIATLTTTNANQAERIRELQQQVLDEQNKVRLFKIHQWPVFIEIIDFDLQSIE
jgi:cell division protein FtsL